MFENLSYNLIVPDPNNLPTLEEDLLNDGKIYLERLKAKASLESFEIISTQKDLLYVLSMSDFIAKTLIQYPDECAKLLAQNLVESPFYTLDLSNDIEHFIQEGMNDIQLKKNLRILRRTRMMLIAWRDLTGRSDIEEVFVSLSNLAEFVVTDTLKVVRKSFEKLYGNAFDREGKEMPLLVMGMGKLGGGELNFSSDIDLMFCYPYDGQTQGGQRSISFQEFFTKIVQKFNNLLSDITVDSFCYRIDLRLRPFGDAGPLVSSFDALQIYYETQGRTWERYALVKAKLLGDFNEWKVYGRELIEMLRPFVYRRYLDYGAFESLRKLKHLIEAEVRRKRLDDNFKLGEGGIREVEFIAQVFELTRGGRVNELVERSLRKTLRHLDKLQLLPSEVSRNLDTCYVFLRRLENIMQEFNDQQTQSLPQKEKDQKRLTIALKQQNYEDVLNLLTKVRNYVHKEFCKVIRDDKKENSQESHENLEIWDSTADAKELATVLIDYMSNKEECDALSYEIVSLRHALQRLPMGEIGRSTLIRLMPILIKHVAKIKNSDKLFRKLANLIEKVATRTTYLQLLIENKQACERLVNLLNENDFAGALIAAHPILLDELIAPHYFTVPPKPNEFLALINEKLLRIDPDDLEDQMEELRLFKQIMVLRIAMSDKAESIPLMKISDCLTFLAEALVREMSILSWNQTVKRFGSPANRTVDNPGFAIIAYGKLGGIELGYKSDLDMVFIRAQDESMTEGENSISVPMFYQKIVQRLLHLSTTRMSGGILYDLDMRLRPDGDSGFLVTDIDGFEYYQKNRAWTWEHQALVRARAIGGSPDLIDKFNKIRDEVLRTARDEVKLKQDVFEMRNKMRAHLDRSSATLFDLKHGKGGMVDIEFIAQYLLLKEAPKHQDMVLWSDNVRIFDECERLSILSKEDVAILKNAYLAIRGAYHKVSLANLPRIVAISDRPKECDNVILIWDRLFS